MRRKTLCLLLPALLLTGCAAEPETRPQKLDLFAMDTYMTASIWSADPSLPDRAAAEISRLEDILSVTNPGSDLSRIREAHGSPVTVSPDTAEIIAKGLETGTESGGALNIALYPVSQLWGFTQEEQHVPMEDILTDALAHTDQTQITLSGVSVTVPDGMQLDLGALAKGYTGDRITALLRENGVSSAILSLGGNVQTVGVKPAGSLWNVGIADPFSPSETICSVQVGEGAVITSGSYQRYFEENGRRWHHILDPGTGFPADNGLVSVTVIGDSGLTCDALSTALFVMGKDRAVRFWEERQDFGMILITDEPALYYTAGLAVKDLPDIPVQVIVHD